MAQQIKSFEEFKTQLTKDPDLQDEFRRNPVEAAQRFQQESPLSTDRWIYRIIVLSLGITILAIIIGVLCLMSSGRITDDGGVPTILTAIGSAAIGALAGLLAPPPKGN